MNPGAVSMTSGEEPGKRAVTGETAGQHTDGKGYSLTLKSKAKPMQDHTCPCQAVPSSPALSQVGNQQEKAC